jgi:hypothetical protein
MPFIICETTGDWAAILGPLLPPSISLIETRRLDEVWERLQGATAAIVALELTLERADEIQAALRRLGDEFPQTVPMVFSTRSLAAWEEVVREAGAVHFVSSTRRIGEVVDLVRRRAASAIGEALHGNEAPSLEDQILGSLPWGD